MCTCKPCCTMPSLLSFSVGLYCKIKRGFFDECAQILYSVIRFVDHTCMGLLQILHITSVLGSVQPVRKEVAVNGVC